MVRTGTTIAVSLGRDVRTRLPHCLSWGLVEFRGTILLDSFKHYAYESNKFEGFIIVGRVYTTVVEGNEAIEGHLLDVSIDHQGTSSSSISKR
jgi:hypothetical protein